MSDVIFARTRHNYDSYQDFWRVVELSNFPIIYVDEIPKSGVSDKVYIATPMNGEWQHGIKTDARVIFWNLEWSMYKPTPGVSEVWCIDQWYAEAIGAKYVPVGGHPGLIDGERVNGVHYDAAYMAYMIPRRQQIHYDLEQVGVTLSPTGAWGELRHSVLCNSRIYVHVHQLKEVPAVPALRMIVAAAYKLPVIMENVVDRGIFGQSGFMTCEYHRLARFVRRWLDDPNGQKLDDFGYALYSQLCEQWTFRRTVENAL
jgi:hypothetical protein